MSSSRKPIGVHLVGSIPVSTAEDAFRLAATHLSGYLKRMPDGEVGERDTWIRWQYAKIASSPQLTPSEKKNIYVPVAPFEIGSNVKSAEQIIFPSLGYADAAIDSFGIFEALVEEGVIPGYVRFQVGLPTPLSVALLYVAPGSRTMFEKAYENALQDELKKMLDVIPVKKLAIQYETVSEFALLEGLLENHLEGDITENITDRVARLVDIVPKLADVGLHLCYGDSPKDGKGKHFCEPEDTGYLANVAGRIVQKANRKINWIHLPVPKERHDDAYFLPLADFDLPDSTDLMLGLVHQTGGTDGTKRRIAAASRVLNRYGVATECGLGRRDPDSIADLLEQHTLVCEPHK
tara:strand:- start:3615 stop:4664 length:1050 start_codon:yes stop_codon:yes gene_type:complete